MEGLSELEYYELVLKNVKTQLVKISENAGVESYEVFDKKEGTTIRSKRASLGELLSAISVLDNKISNLK